VTEALSNSYITTESVHTHNYAAGETAKNGKT